MSPQIPQHSAVTTTWSHNESTAAGVTEIRASADLRTLYGQAIAVIAIAPADLPKMDGIEPRDRQCRERLDILRRAVEAGCEDLSWELHQAGYTMDDQDLALDSIADFELKTHALPGIISAIKKAHLDDDIANAERCFALFKERPDDEAARQSLLLSMERLNGVTAPRGALTKAMARELYQGRAYDHAHPKPPATAIYQLAGVTIATPGNVVVITAQQGSGKSSFVGAGLAAPMGRGDFLGLESENPDGHAVIHIDTEQSEADFDLLIREKAITRVELDEPPPWLMSTHLTGCTPMEIVAALEIMLADAVERHGGVHSVWLDGIADAINSPNDEEEANGIVRRVHSLAIKYACPVICILHLNPGSDFKSRGHLGSQLERKAETVLQLKKAEEAGRDVTTTLATKTRHRPIPESVAPRFAWSDDHRMHMSVETKGQARVSVNEQEAFDIVRAVWSNDRRASFPYEELVRQVARFLGKSESTAKRRIGFIFQLNLVHESIMAGGYVLSVRGSKLFEPESTA